MDVGEVFYIDARTAANGVFAEFFQEVTVLFEAGHDIDREILHSR